MTNYLYYNYYYRYRELRKQIKTIVDNQSYIEAKTRLDTLIAEHVSKYPDSDTRLDFNYGEKIMINHALAHINNIISVQNDPIPSLDPDVITKQTNSVQTALQQVPKPDYNNDDD